MRNFKKTMKVVICILALAVILKALDVALYPCTFMRNDVHTVTTEQRDVIIMGTSHGKMDLDPDVMLQGTEKTGHNLCVGGEYPIDAYYLAKLIIEKQKPEQIIFELDPGYFMTEKEPGNNYLLFYHEFPMSLAKAEYYKDAFLDKDFKTTFFPFYEYPLSYEIEKIKDTVYQKTTGNYDVAYLKGQAQEYHENGFIERYPVDEADFKKSAPVVFQADKVNPENMEYLDKLIQLCKDNGIVFRAAVMPLPAVTLVEYQESYSQAWQFFASYFAGKNVDFYNFNVEYYDAYAHDIAHYADYDGHMNGDSAREFSAVFGKIIEE